MKIVKGCKTEKPIVNTKKVKAASEFVQDPKVRANFYINKAISELSKIAEDDEIARDSIANLGVVLLDLNG